MSEPDSDPCLFRSSKFYSCCSNCCCSPACHVPLRLSVDTVSSSVTLLFIKLIQSCSEFTCSAFIHNQFSWAEQRGPPIDHLSLNSEQTAGNRWGHSYHCGRKLCFALDSLFCCRTKNSVLPSFFNFHVFYHLWSVLVVRDSQRSRMSLSMPASTSTTTRKILCTPTSEQLSPTDTQRKLLSTLLSGFTESVQPRGEHLLTL